MSGDQKIKGIIQKVARVNGKAEAQMTVAIPVVAAGDIPLGEVFITIKEANQSMFDGPIRGVAGKQRGKKNDDEDED